MSNYKETLAEISLNANDSLVFYFDNIFEREVFIEIENKDNPALLFDSIICEQKTDYLVCELKAGQNYFLKCGNPSLSQPEYDLTNFTDKIPKQLNEVSVSEFKTIQSPIRREPILIEKPFYEQRAFLWICLGGTALILLWFSRNLLKDMNRKE